MIHGCHKKGIPCVKFCESPNEKHRCGINQRDKKMLKVATLFSGIGTPEQSLTHLKVEHETIFACEIDKYARITYLANNKEPNTFYEDVYNIDGNIYKDQIDILIGGSPCQSFSIAGKRMGTECPRGNLIYEYFRIVEESKPKVFIYENVKGFLSIDKIDKKEKYGETFKNFVQSFKELGYTIYYEILNTKDYGVPQNRERIYIVGFKDEVEFSFQEKQELKLRLKDMLEDEVDEKYLLKQYQVENIEKSTFNQKKNIVTDENKEFIGTLLSRDYKDPKVVKIANGLIEVDDEVRVKEATKLGYKVAEEGDSINISVPSSKTRRGRVGKQVAQTLDTACNQVIFAIDKSIKPPVAKNIEREMEDILKSDKDFYVCKADAGWQDNKVGLKTSPTIRANNSSIYGLDRANYIFRKLSPRECFRLQGFDDSFIFPDKMSNTQLYKQAGNGMSRNVLDMIFTQILTCYSKHIEEKQQ